MINRKEDLLIQADHQLPELFLPLLEKGGSLEVLVGITLRELLVDQLEIDNAYIESQIQTIFINARAIDDLDQTVIQDGDVLALSGAMPGLVGATLRRGGKYAVMRKDISGTAVTSTPSVSRGGIRLKLFNTILYDIGPAIFSRGVSVLVADLIDILQHIRTELELSGVTLFVGEEKMSLPMTIAAIENKEYCVVRISSPNSNKGLG